MISTELFTILLILDGAFILFSIWDNENRIYGNILASFLASVFSFFLAINQIAGNVGTETIIHNTTITNSTTYLNMSVTMDNWIYARALTTFQDSGFMWLMILVGISMAFITFLYIAELLYERQAGIEIGEEEG